MTSLATSKKLFLYLAIVTKVCTELPAPCKTNQIGDDFLGRLAKSSSGQNCEHWSTVTKELKINFRDYSFPDGSKQMAKNYCRNPTREPSGPWCYVRNTQLQNFSCAVPFCENQDCRVTGPGEEYRGEQNTAIGGKECMTWQSRQTYHNLNDSFFCSTKEAEKCDICRNPDKNKAGPWCFTSGESVSEVQLCNIPFCDDGPVRLLKGGKGDVATFHRLINSSSLSIRIRLWDPSDWYDGRIVIVLSALDTPTGIKDFEQWGSALSLSLGNTGSAILGNKIYDRTASPGILSASNWTDVRLTWKQDEPDLGSTLELNVFYKEDKNPRLVANVDTSNTVLQNYPFSYFSVIGTLSFFQFASGQDDCLITTTMEGNQTMWLQLQKNLEQIDVAIQYRIYNDGNIHFKQFPEQDDIVTIQFFSNGTIYVKDLERDHAFEYSMEPQDFWAWHSINISISGTRLFVARYSSEQNVLKNETIIPSTYKLAWIGMSSISVGQWAINCDPTELPGVLRPEPPECASTKAELDYNGVQSISETGKQCIPWIDKRVREKYRSDSFFEGFESRLLSNNFCRNLDSNENGPFCFVKQSNYRNDTVVKEFCNIRKCSMLDCKHSGIGTDYTGNLLHTKSQRTCSIDYCRNPDKSLGGPWCYTNDTKVPRDYCNIQDCQRQKSQAILVSHEDDNCFYILPHWRKVGLSIWLKNWMPERNAYATIKIMDISRNYFKLLINEDGNEKVQLRIVLNDKEELLLEETMPNLIRTGGWTGLWLRCGSGSIELGHENIEVPFLAWESKTHEYNWKLHPSFLSFHVQNNSWLGIDFNSKECMIEKVINNSHKYWPIPFEANEREKNTLLNLFIRGSGIVRINFYAYPESPDYYSLIIQNGTKVSWGSFQNTMRFLAEVELLHQIIGNNSWTQLHIRFNETIFTVGTNNNPVLVHTVNFLEEPLIFYWFNVNTQFGEFSWASNCEPLDISGAARDGGFSEWGPWECSVSCGGGSGRRERKCTNPPPNILGMDCTGPTAHEGNCNDFPCGDISPDIHQLIRIELSSKSIFWHGKNGSSHILDCNSNVSLLLIDTIPKVDFTWNKNGIAYGVENKLNRSSLELWDMRTNDSGVWTCSAFWEYSGVRKAIVVQIVALLVTSDTFTITARETLPLVLHSNALALGQVYADLSLRWQLNGYLLHDYGVISMDLVNFERIKEVDKSHAGIWICIVTQEDLGLKWVTAWYNVNVIEPPNFWSHLIEDNATSALFGSMTEDEARVTLIIGLALFSILVLAIAIGICIL